MLPDFDGLLLLALELLLLGLLPLLLARLAVVGPRVPRPVTVPPTLPRNELCVYWLLVGDWVDTTT